VTVHLATNVNTAKPISQSVTHRERERVTDYKEFCYRDRVTRDELNLSFFRAHQHITSCSRETGVPINSYTLLLLHIILHHKSVTANETKSDATGRLFSYNNKMWIKNTILKCKKSIIIKHNYVLIVNKLKIRTEIPTAACTKYVKGTVAINNSSCGHKICISFLFARCHYLSNCVFC